MKSSRVTIAVSLLIALLAGTLIIPLRAQEDPSDSTTNTSDESKRVDKKRLCLNRKNQPNIGDSDVPVFYKTTWGNNPQEGQYRQEMERLLRIEISNVKRAVADIEKKHEALINLYPSLSSKQVIVLEDVPGVWRNNLYVNSKKLIVFHYDTEKKLECVVLDSFVRNIHNDNDYTRKLLRLYYPNVQTMEMETIRHNYEEGGTLDHTSPEVQLRALRFVFLQLRTALYRMDMMIAAFYDRRNKLNYWQIDL
ncbi:MAG: hypothetical protein KDK39_01585 [Leptospiraceae bacterium]|nr:hypothetical protein [Leptospiraceae bacterium]